MWVESMQIPLCYVPDTLNKMLADWLSQRPADALCKFIVWILKEILDDAHAHAGSHKSSKHSAPPSQKTKVRERRLVHHLFKLFWWRVIQS